MSILNGIETFDNSLDGTSKYTYRWSNVAYENDLESCNLL
jgi:hypothetical protein